MNVIKKIKKNKNILGKRMKIVFLERIRKEIKFHSTNSLTLRIKKDIDLISSKYSRYPAHFTQLIAL